MSVRTDSAEGATAAERLAERVAEAMYRRDHAAQALGIRIEWMKPGAARLAMRVRADMVNGHGICHGGMIFSLADTAFAYACNSYNANTVAATAAIDFLSPARERDELTATAQELWRSGRSGIYEIVVAREDGERVALFRGRSHRIDGHVVSDPE